MGNIAAFFDIDGTLYRDSLLIEHFKKLIKYDVVEEEKWSDDRFVCICAYEDKDGYYEAKLIVSIDKTTVRKVEGIYSDFINIEEYKSYYKLRSIMVIDKYPISEYDAFCLISKPELIKKYRILDDMKKDDISRELINMCPAIQTNDYERGILLTQYYIDLRDRKSVV